MVHPFLKLVSFNIKKASEEKKAQVMRYSEILQFKSSSVNTFIHKAENKVCRSKYHYFIRTFCVSMKCVAFHTCTARTTHSDHYSETICLVWKNSERRTQHEQALLVHVRESMKKHYFGRIQALLQRILHVSQELIVLPLTWLVLSGEGGQGTGGGM